MANPKRKRTTRQTTKTNKRIKYKEPSSPDHVNSSDPTQWQARAVLDERTVKGIREYLVDWEDSPSGTEYEPEWTREIGTWLLRQWSKEKKKKKRQSRLVESSSSPCAPPSVPSTSLAQSAVARVPQSPQVLIQKQPSFDPQEYDRFSQPPATPQSAGSARRSYLASSQSSLYSGPRNYRALGIVPDSEDESEVDHRQGEGEGEEEDEDEDEEEEEELLIDGSASYVASTQNESNGTLTRPRTLSTNPDLEYSSLRSTDPATPAPSIPETETETEPGATVEVVESSQVQPETERVVPDTFDTADTIVSTSQPAPQEEVHIVAGTDESNIESGVVVSQLETDTEGQEQSAQEFDVGREHIESESAYERQDLEQNAEHVTARAAVPWNPNLAILRQASPPPQPQREQSPLTAIFCDQIYPTAIHEQTIPHAQAASEPPKGAPEVTITSAVPESSIPLESAQHLETTTTPAESVNEEQDSIERRDFATPSDSVGGIRPTTEQDPVSSHSTPQSRHDSSQESPRSSPHTYSSSPLPQPPIQSLETLSSNAPARPRTPAISHSPSATMSGNGPDIHEIIREAARKRNRESPAIPPLVLKKSKMFPDIGTRSPSTIPAERSSPVPQMPASLRTVAASSSSHVEAEAQAAPESPPKVAPEPIPEAAAAQVQQEGAPDSHRAPVATPVDAPVVIDIDAPVIIDIDDALSEDEDDDDDDDSLFNEHLQLQQNEFIVPLPMDGRQAKTYKDELTNNVDTISAFVQDYKHFEPLAKVEKVLQRLRAIETHVDLIYGDIYSNDSSTQFQHQAQWSYDNSIKFRFVGALLHKLQNSGSRVILVLEKNDDRLFRIVDSFLRGRFIDFRTPGRDHEPDSSRIEGNLLVTILSSDSCYLVQPPDLIICLDGHLQASQIRQKDWSNNPDKEVPILHLIIPRSVDHIELYVSKTYQRKRMHTILATLGQYHAEGEIGRAAQHTPKTNEAADAVADFLTQFEGGAEWPLPSIGNIKEDVEFATQFQQTNSTMSPQPTGTSKRSLDVDNVDPSKRMRFTPQPASSENRNDITHISDSMPGTAVQVSRLQEQLAQMKREVAYFKDRERNWEKQQVVYDDFRKTYRALKTEKEESERRLESIIQREASLRERLNTKSTEHQELKSKFKALQENQLLSTDAQLVEITRLTKDLEAAKDSERRAIKSQQATEKMFEYAKDQYNDAPGKAAAANEEVEVLRTRLETAEHKASGQINGLARLHYDRVKEQDTRKLEDAHNQIKMLNKEVAHLEDQNQKLKASRASGFGVSTRAQSTGPRTRPGSRAASPLPGNRDRVTNLRNG
ncbi:hypothetical protein P280DRAFT_17165 [Massarina eburnea CBS 473.64]|uniref:Chromo domain-containing protein n=1 Tax=Massarina eburnea CBS 473.64 TaxID=1395130 RepID=A0A6A6SJ98_9PLEO|nr:hypothetical protein P280DRAFT_17165 [Massarina eburnea CBS 473.64]